MDLGLMVEGFVEMGPYNRVVLRVPQGDGSDHLVDIQAELEKYLGRQIRFISTPLENIAALAKLVEAGEVRV